MHIGAAVGTLVIVYTAFLTNVPFMWFGMIGCLATFIATQLASRFLTPPLPSQVDGLRIVGNTKLFSKTKHQQASSSLNSRSPCPLKEFLQFWRSSCSSQRR